MGECTPTKVMFAIDPLIFVFTQTMYMCIVIATYTCTCIHA